MRNRKDREVTRLRHELRQSVATHDSAAAATSTDPAGVSAAVPAWFVPPFSFPPARLSVDRFVFIENILAGVERRVDAAGSSESNVRVRAGGPGLSRVPQGAPASHPNA